MLLKVLFPYHSNNIEKAPSNKERSQKFPILTHPSDGNNCDGFNANEGFIYS